jgi:hypothetical protein
MRVRDRRHVHRTRHALWCLALLTSLTACSAQEAAVMASTRPPTVAERSLFGAFTYGGVWHGMEPVLRLEADLGRRLDVVHWFTNWDNAYYPGMVQEVAQGGRVPLISWQPMRQGLAAIAAGEHDGYVREWARGVATAPGLVYVRPFPEMNGDWVPWNGDPAAFRAAWRRIAELFADEGTDNVRWVFGPNVTDEPRTEANRLEHYYPGHDVVDLFALSGYNWGDTKPDIGWRSFEEIFRSGYDRLTALGDQDVWLAEIASAEEGGDKSAWIREMLGSVAFPRIGAIVWFNEEKEADWRLESSPEALQAFRSWFR